MKEESYTQPPTETSPQRSGRGSGPPKAPTAVATGQPRAELLIVNTTDTLWRVECSQILTVRIGPKGEEVVYIRARGAVTVVAVPDQIDDKDAAMTLVLDPGTWGIEITQGDGSRGFAMRPLARRRCYCDVPLLTTPIEDLNLLASTENALKRRGIVALGEALRIPVDDILSVPNYPLRALFDLLEQVHGLRID